MCDLILFILAFRVWLVNRYFRISGLVRYIWMDIFDACRVCS